MKQKAGVFLNKIDQPLARFIKEKRWGPKSIKSEMKKKL